MIICSRNLWLHSVAQGTVRSRSLLDHISVSLSVCYYRSSASSQFCPVDTGSYKGHFFQTEDRRLYELHDSCKCHTWTLWPYTSPRYTFTAPAQQTSRNKVSTYSTDSLCGILSSNGHYHSLGMYVAMAGKIASEARFVPVVWIKTQDRGATITSYQ